MVVGIDCRSFSTHDNNDSGLAVSEPHCQQMVMPGGASGLLINLSSYQPGRDSGCRVELAEFSALLLSFTINYSAITVYSEACLNYKTVDCVLLGVSGAEYSAGCGGDCRFQNLFSLVDFFCCVISLLCFRVCATCHVAWFVVWDLHSPSSFLLT